MCSGFTSELTCIEKTTITIDNTDRRSVSVECSVNHDCEHVFVEEGEQLAHITHYVCYACARVRVIKANTAAPSFIAALCD